MRQVNELQNERSPSHYSGSSWQKLFSNDVLDQRRFAGRLIADHDNLRQFDQTFADRSRHILQSVDDRNQLIHRATVNKNQRKENKESSMSNKLCRADAIEKRSQLDLLTLLIKFI